MDMDIQQPGLSHRHKGHAIELLAERWLEQQGLTLVERNFTIKAGEIDLIMWERDTLVFVEVRYRATTEHGSGAESITRHKMQKIRRTANFYLQSKFGNKPPFCRIDVLSGEGDPVIFDWIQNAFA